MFKYKTIVENAMLIFLVWLILFGFFRSHYISPPEVINLEFETPNSLVASKRINISAQSLNKANRDITRSKAVKDIANSIGIDSLNLEYDLYVTNNYKLAFESSEAKPSLAYGTTTLGLTLNGGEKWFQYQARELLVGSIAKSDIPIEISSLGFFVSKPNPVQEISPNSNVNISLVGHILIDRDLNWYSKIKIGILSLIAVVALFHWLRQFTHYLILGPRKFFLVP